MRESSSNSQPKIGLRERFQSVSQLFVILLYQNHYSKQWSSSLARVPVVARTARCFELHSNERVRQTAPSATKQRLRQTNMICVISGAMTTILYDTLIALYTRTVSFKCGLMPIVGPRVNWGKPCFDAPAHARLFYQPRRVNQPAARSPRFNADSFVTMLLRDVNSVSFKVHLLRALGSIKKKKRKKRRKKRQVT